MIGFEKGEKGREGGSEVEMEGSGPGDAWWKLQKEDLRMSAFQIFYNAYLIFHHE